MMSWCTLAGAHQPLPPPPVQATIPFRWRVYLKQWLGATGVQQQQQQPWATLPVLFQEVRQ